MNPKPYSDNSPYIFIRYAHKASDQILPNARTLAENGFRVWYDEGMIRLAIPAVVGFFVGLFSMDDRFR